MKEKTVDDPNICPNCNNTAEITDTSFYEGYRVDEYFCPDCESDYKIMYDLDDGTWEYLDEEDD